MAVAVEEHRRSGEWCVVLASGHADSSAEQPARQPDICGVAEEVDIATDYLSGEATVRQTASQIGCPDSYCLSSDQNHMSLADDLLQARDDPFSLSETQRRRSNREVVLRLDHSYKSPTAFRTGTAPTPG